MQSCGGLMTEPDKLNSEQSETPAPIVVSLDYLTPRSSSSSLLSIPWASIAAAGKVLFGAILAGFLWIAVGLYHMDRLPLIVGESRTLRPLSLQVAILFFAVSGVSIALLVVPRNRPLHLLIGLLIGSAITGVIGGMMFAAG